MALIDKDQAKSEIKRIMSRAMNEEGQDICEYILAFLDTLPEQEHPIYELNQILLDWVREAKTDKEHEARFDAHKRFFELYDEYMEQEPEQPELPGIEKEGIPGRDFIPVEWVDACERYGKWKIVQKVQPASEGLEEEIDRYWKEEMPVVTESDLNDIARHFYELGCRHTAVMYDDIEYERQRTEEAENKEFEKELHQYWLEQKREGVIVDGSIDDYITVQEVARHFAEWGAEHLKKYAEF